MTKAKGKRQKAKVPEKLRVVVGMSGGVDPSSTLTGSRGLRPRARLPRTSTVGQVARARLRGRVRVAIGMSGGVDSSVSAVLLKEQGYDVTGVFLECWKEPGCRTDQDRKDALAVALKLKIPFKVMDFRKEYKQKVVRYFYREYKAGRTPNPDVMCNKEIKFGLFYDWAMKQGFDYVSTGHYARIKKVKIPASPAGRQNSKVKYQLLRGVDDKKDQSYFLYRLRQEQLAHILFPVGEMTKEEVRQKARQINLLVADKPDSQGICFIGEVNIQEFLRRKLPVKKGEVVIKVKIQKLKIPSTSRYGAGKSTSQNSKVKIKRVKDENGDENYECEVIGEHDGVWFYTVGQRHGFRISNKQQVTSNKMRHIVLPMYVIDKDIKHNRLVVGFGAETYRDQFQVEDLSWITEISNKYQFPINTNFQCRIRHGGELIRAEVKMKKEKGESNKVLEAKLAEPQRGIAAGQSAVFYAGEECLGGGVITETKSKK